MSIAEKLTAIAENVPKVYEAGQKSEYDRFWDAYQNNGKLWTTVILLPVLIGMTIVTIPNILLNVQPAQIC